MGFETVILSVIKDVARSARAEFQYGTLFVSNVDDTEANRILNNIRSYTTGEIILSQVGDEYSYDFA